METAVFKATNRIECAPKAKHVRYLIASTWARDVDIGLLFKYLSDRLHDSSWVTVFKALVVIHTLARDGCAERVLNYLAGATHLLNLAGFRSRSALGAEQTKNIHAYAAYLEEKVAVFRELRIDFAGRTADVVARLRGGQEKDEWRLNEIRVLQREIDAVLGCKFFLDEINNEVTLAAYRLIVFDLLKLFHAGNEGVMNLLEHYFEMNKADARKSLNVYKKFCTQTEKVVEFLDVARRLQTALGTAIPRMKHAPISLAVTLEDYLNSSDFEANREEYKARKARKALNRSGDMSQSTTIKRSSSVEKRESSVVPALKGAGADIIDFFSSLDADQPARQVSSFSFTQGQAAGIDHFSAGLHNPFGGSAPSSAPPIIRTAFGGVGGDFGGPAFGGVGGDFGGPQSFGNFGDTEMQNKMAGVPSSAASFSTHNPFTPQLGPAQFGTQQPGFGTQVPAGVFAGDNFGNQMYAAGQPRPFAGAGANASPGVFMGSRGSLASIGTNDLLGGSTPFTVTPPSLNPFSPARYSTITSAPAPGVVSNAVQPRHMEEPFDSLSSLNPFAPKPPPAAPVPIASMASSGGFGGGGGGGGGPFGGASAGATPFGSGPSVFNSQDSTRRSVFGGQGGGGGGGLGAFEGPAGSLVQQDRLGGTIDPFGMTASSAWANPRQQQQQQQQQPNPFGATTPSPFQPLQQQFGQQLSQQPSWGI